MRCSLLPATVSGVPLLFTDQRFFTSPEWQRNALKQRTSLGIINPDCLVGVSTQLIISTRSVSRYLLQELGLFQLPGRYSSSFRKSSDIPSKIGERLRRRIAPGKTQVSAPLPATDATTIWEREGKWRRRCGRVIHLPRPPLKDKFHPGIRTVK